MPSLSIVLDDLGGPPASVIARALGVSPRTVGRWIAADFAPRPAMLALFWLTRWGRDARETQAVNDARMAVQVARSHELVAQERLAQLEHLLSVGEFGAANAPLIGQPLPSGRRASSASAAIDGAALGGAGGSGHIGGIGDLEPVRAAKAVRSA